MGPLLSMGWGRSLLASDGRNWKRGGGDTTVAEGSIPLLRGVGAGHVGGRHPSILRVELGGSV